MLMELEPVVLTKIPDFLTPSFHIHGEIRAKNLTTLREKLPHGEATGALTYLNPTRTSARRDCLIIAAITCRVSNLAQPHTTVNMWAPLH